MHHKKITNQAVLFLTAAISLMSCQSRPSDSLILTVNWPGAEITDLPVTVPADSLLARFPAFDPATVVLLEGADTVPCQFADTNGDGKADVLLFLTAFEQPGSREYRLIRAQAGAGKFTQRAQAVLSVKTGGAWNGRVYEGGAFSEVTSLRVPAQHTDHSGLIRFEGPGWESDKIAYRFYLDWRNATDIFGKQTDSMVLQQVGREGLNSYHDLSPWGMDVFKVGESLGVGSIGMWAQGKVNMVSVTDSLFSRIVLNGPLQAQVETRYYGWQAGGIKQNMVSRLSIYAGSRLTCHDVEVEDPATVLCTGLILNDSVQVVTNAAGNDPWVYFGTWGYQSLNHDSLGIAVLVRRADLQEITADKQSHVLVFRSGKTSLRYYFAAAWEREVNGIKTTAAFEKYLQEQAAMLSATPAVTLKKNN